MSGGGGRGVGGKEWEEGKEGMGGNGTGRVVYGIGISDFMRPGWITMT